jgi:acyl-CoA reductase-like NAD-dependent aldehyde dehydrogenase
MFETVINEDALADQALEAATRYDFEEWRELLTEGRRPRNVNRYARQIMAGLNRAVELGRIGNPAAWKLKPL